MRNYVVPPDLKEKEKIIGGILTLAQFLWLVSGAALGAVLFMSLFSTFGGIFSLIVGLACCGIGAPFAFYKKKGLPLFSYCRLKWTFRQRTKRIINFHKGGRL